MKNRTIFAMFVNILFIAAIVGVCIAFQNIVVRVLSFIIALFLAFMSFCFFERIKLGDDFLKSHTGKAGFPGSVRACITCGIVTLAGAIFFVYCGIRH
jgi:hypothetical protein